MVWLVGVALLMATGVSIMAWLGRVPDTRALPPLGLGLGYRLLAVRFPALLPERDGPLVFTVLLYLETVALGVALLWLPVAVPFG